VLSNFALLCLVSVLLAGSVATLAPSSLAPGLHDVQCQSPQLDGFSLFSFSRRVAALLAFCFVGPRWPFEV
jgi:hypothetical protein